MGDLAVWGFGLWRVLGGFGSFEVLEFVGFGGFGVFSPTPTPPPPDYYNIINILFLGREYRPVRKSGQCHRFDKNAVPEWNKI